MLAHEALHCALSHFAHRWHRVRHKWDLACDYAINPLLIDEGLMLPPHALHIPLYKGMTAEEIYPLIEDNDTSQTLDKHAYDHDNQSRGRGGLREDGLTDRLPAADPQDGERGSGTQARSEQESGGGAAEPEPLQPDEQETLNVQWQQRMAGAAQQAMQAGKLGGELARMIDHLLQPQLPWRMLLARHMTAAAQDDYSYMRPFRCEGDFILPALRSHQLELVVAVDTSGSIKERELTEFIAELDALKGQIRPRVTLLPCDTALCAGAPWVFEPWEEFTPPDVIKGCGGTSFLPVFDWVERAGLFPDLLIYFTDAQGAFPPEAPHYPVVWLVKGRSQVPWGQRIQLN